MADGIKLCGVVLFVRELTRSKDFYGPLLDLEVVLELPEAVVLSGSSGDHLVLRGAAEGVADAWGVGVQYLAWAAPNAEELRRCEELLKAHDAFVSKTRNRGTTLVEGHDPENTPVVVVHPALRGVGVSSIPTRFYGY